MTPQPQTGPGLRVGVTRETFPGDRRVALVPASVRDLNGIGLGVLVETGAGEAAGFPDAAYEERGAEIRASRDAVIAEADVVAQVRTVGANPEAGRPDLERFRADQVVIGLADPLGHPPLAAEIAARGVVLLALELLPRITRAQAMDALSSMATVAGYKAVLLAADALPRMFPMLMTAAGTVTPARVLVIGAGVAGLQAIATARRLGAVVRAYDIRPAVKEEVESLGAAFIEADLEVADAEDAGGYATARDEAFHRRQQAALARAVAASDVVITTAAVPGRRAPVLVSREMLAPMPPGSVVVDLAAEQGGNCEATVPGETAQVGGVAVIGPVNVAAMVPYHASQMFAKNVTNLLTHLMTDGAFRFDRDDEITAGVLVTRGGEVVHPRVREALDLPPLPDRDEGDG